MKTISIITKSPYIHHRIIQGIKNIIRYMLGHKIYGPNSVIQSLQRGLSDGQLEEQFNIKIQRDPHTSKLSNTVRVITGGVNALKYAIHQKKKGRIKTLLAGPNINVVQDKNDILFNILVDYIVMPSQWCIDYMKSINSNGLIKYILRPAGIEKRGISHKGSKSILIYKKQCSKELYSLVCNTLQKNHISYNTIVYGNYKSIDYEQALHNCVGMIYLQESESQGIALQEARGMDIPTLVWDRGFRSYQNKKRRVSRKISCPLLTKDCGETFQIKDFKIKMKVFIENIDKFKSREYVLKNLTDEITTANILNIINKIC